MEDKNEKTDVMGNQIELQQTVNEIVNQLDNENLANGNSFAEVSETDGDAIGQSEEELKKQNTELGKFKNPSELLRAYNQLEKEFTKRSQKLKELEGELEKVNIPFQPDENQWKEAVDKFFEETPSAKPFAKEIAKEILSYPELKEDKNCLTNALTKVLVKKFRTPEELIGDGQFLNDYILTSDKVKNAVISGYLQGIRQGKPPVILKEDGELGVATKSEPKSIAEAGLMFLKNNR